MNTEKRSKSSPANISITYEGLTSLEFLGEMPFSFKHAIITCRNCSHNIKLSIYTVCDDHMHFFTPLILSNKVVYSDGIYWYNEGGEVMA